MEPTNPVELDGAAAGWGPEVGGATTVVVVEGVVEGAVKAEVEGEVDEGIGSPLTWEWVWEVAIRAVLEHAARSPLQRRPVATRTTRRRAGRGTGAHHSRGSSPLVLSGLSLVLVVLLASCGASGHAAARHRVATHVTTLTTSTAPTTVPAPVATTVAPTVAAPARVKVAAPAPVTTAPRPVTTTPPVPLLVTRLVGVGSATQVIAVSASGYGQTTATLTAYQQDAAGWHQVFGPWQARVGYNGFAPPGQKREGDGRTPSGSYGFDFFFGVFGNPGVRFPYRSVTGRNLVWDDDPSSPLYNQWVDTDTANPGATPEPMDQTPVYDYGAVISYNTSPTVPGSGSAIFLHVSDGAATTGCVALPTSELLAILRWLSPSAQPRIIMGTAATIAP
ncbi:MAG TPA: L,D-transpeptidase family protein [Acidimicrobiales bacterium]|nr:L,D-transpeptidase family protein [Acidimicrobiales bacterium]